MKTRLLLSLCLTVLSLSLTCADETADRDAARKLYADEPRTVETVRKAAAALTAVADANAKNVDDQWQAARAWCWLADYGANEDEKKSAAQKGIDLSERAIAVDEKRVEGHYFRARSIGMMADIERGMSALGRIKEMRKALERAIELDEKFDEGGPHRLLGLVFLDAPGWPISFGSVKEADKHIHRAVQLVPAYPENQIALGKLLHKQKDDDTARLALNKALKAQPWPGKLDEDASWKEGIKKFLKDELK